MTHQVHFHLVRIVKGYDRHPHVLGRNEHGRLVIDVDTCRGRVRRFLEEELVDPWIGLPHAGVVGEDASSETMHKSVGRLQVVDPILRVVGHVKQLVSGDSQPVDEAYGPGNRFLGFEPDGRELLV